MSSPVSSGPVQEGLQGAVFGGVVRGVVLPAAPDDVEPGAGEDADGVGVVVAAGSGSLVEVGGPGVGAAAVGSSVAFFTITNFGMWLFSGFYPVTYAGLVACYAAAIPFFQNTIAGDLFYAALLFGGFQIAELMLPRLREGPEGNSPLPA